MPSVLNCPESSEGFSGVELLSASSDVQIEIAIGIAPHYSGIGSSGI